MIYCPIYQVIDLPSARAFFHPPRPPSRGAHSSAELRRAFVLCVRPHPPHPPALRGVGGASPHAPLCSAALRAPGTGILVANGLNPPPALPRQSGGSVGGYKLFVTAFTAKKKKACENSTDFLAQRERKQRDGLFPAEARFEQLALVLIALLRCYYTASLEKSQ